MPPLSSPDRSSEQCTAIPGGVCHGRTRITQLHVSFSTQPLLIKAIISFPPPHELLLPPFSPVFTSCFTCVSIRYFLSLDFGLWQPGCLFFFFFTSASVVVFLQVVTMTTGAVVPSDEVVAELCASSLRVILAFVKV